MTKKNYENLGKNILVKFLRCTQKTKSRLMVEMNSSLGTSNVRCKVESCMGSGFVRFCESG